MTMPTLTQKLAEVARQRKDIHEALRAAKGARGAAAVEHTNDPSPAKLKALEQTENKVRQLETALDRLDAAEAQHRLQAEADTREANVAGLAQRMAEIRGMTKADLANAVLLEKRLAQVAELVVGRSKAAAIKKELVLDAARHVYGRHAIGAALNLDHLVTINQAPLLAALSEMIQAAAAAGDSTLHRSIELRGFTTPQPPIAAAAAAQAAELDAVMSRWAVPAHTEQRKPDDSGDQRLLRELGLLNGGTRPTLVNGLSIMPGSIVEARHD